MRIVGDLTLSFFRTPRRLPNPRISWRIPSSYSNLKDVALPTAAGTTSPQPTRGRSFLPTSPSLPTVCLLDEREKQHSVATKRGVSPTLPYRKYAFQIAHTPFLHARVVLVCRGRACSCVRHTQLTPRQLGAARRANRFSPATKLRALLTARLASPRLGPPAAATRRRGDDAPTSLHWSETRRSISAFTVGHHEQAEHVVAPLYNYARAAACCRFTTQRPFFAVSPTPRAAVHKIVILNSSSLD